MKRLMIFLFAITAISSVSMAGMSSSRVRKETRFLTDKMAYELKLSTGQYNDVYEINYDFIYAIGDLMDNVVRGEEWAMDRYYRYLDIRNDDLRWVLSASQYRRFMTQDYFYRPVYASGGRWNFRIYITYTNHNHFYFGRPYHYNSYSGGHRRPHYSSNSYYRGRYKHDHYSGSHSLRDEKVYRGNRRSDFGSIQIKPNTNRHESTPRRGNSVPRRDINNGSLNDQSGSRGNSSRRPSSTKESNDKKNNRREPAARPSSSRSSGSMSSGSNRREKSSDSNRMNDSRRR